MSWSLKNLREVEDSAPKFGFSETQEARFPREELGAESIGLAYHVVRPGRHMAFGHKHDEAEEVYVVLAGSGQMKLDDEIVDVGELDAIRVAPSVVRSFAAGPEGLQVLAFGPRREGDGELLHDFWPE